MVSTNIIAPVGMGIPEKNCDGKQNFCSIRGKLYLSHSMNFDTINKLKDYDFDTLFVL